jgi:hypothetical protein
MGAVYQNALFTLAAESSEDGLYIESSKLNSAIASIECPGPGDGKSCIYVRKSIEIWYRQNSNAKQVAIFSNRPKLQTRGWTLQEHILSPRIIRFTTLEMMWECFSQQKCECSLLEEPIQDSPKASFAGIISAPTDLEYSVWKFWRDIVYEFTTRDLTYVSDRLPALAGLADVISTFSQDTYLWGLWQKSLWQDLLWYIATPLNSKRQDGRYAPSWSWASVTGCIHYISGADGHDPKVSVRFLEISYESDGPDAIGHVKLEGPIIPVRLQQCNWEKTTKRYPILVRLGLKDWAH